MNAALWILVAIEAIALLLCLFVVVVGMRKYDGPPNRPPARNPPPPGT